MGVSIKQLADKFVDAARKNPVNRPAILGEAANTFMRLSRDPENHALAPKLKKLGLDFAHHASLARQERPPVVDDFADLLHETQQAYEEVGPYGDDPMDLIARRREIHQDRTPVDPNHLFVTPETFQRDATLGRSAKIKWNPSSNDIQDGITQTQNVAFWQGVKRESVAMTIDTNFVFTPTIALVTPTQSTIGPLTALSGGEIYNPFEPFADVVTVDHSFAGGTFHDLTTNTTGTIVDNVFIPVDNATVFTVSSAIGMGDSFTVTSPPPPPVPVPQTAGQVIRPYVEVEFGSDGNRSKVTFDLGRGNRLTVPANYLSVTIGMNPPPNGHAANDPIIVGASIGAFGAPSQAPLLSTQYIDGLAAGAVSTFMQIPLKAVQLLPILTTLPMGGTLTVSFFDYGGALIGQTFFQQGANYAASPIPLPGDAVFVQVQSAASNVAPATIRLPFELSM